MEKLNNLQTGMDRLTRVANGDLIECADGSTTVERLAQVSGAIVKLTAEKRQLRIKAQDERKAKREADKKREDEAKAEKKGRMTTPRLL